jgi:glycosyltransferase involved in cell wall biosynthesis
MENSAPNLQVAVKGAESSNGRTVRAAKVRYRLLTIAHSYCVVVNRRLAHEMARLGGDNWEVTAVAPKFFYGDLKPIVASPGNDELCRFEMVPAHLTNRVHIFFYGLKLREILHRGWDLVHCWEEPYIVAGAQVAWWTPVETPLVFWTGQTISKNYPMPFSAIERYCVERCAGWMTRGQKGLDALIPRGYAKKPYRAVSLGVDTDLFRPDRAAGSEIKTRLGWSDSGPPVVGFLGRFVEEKGIRSMTAALERLQSPWRAMFVGGGPLDVYLRSWSGAFRDRVRVVTGVSHDQVPAHLNAMDILCAPSQSTERWREVFGRMIVEAFACGVPVIASDCGEIPNVVGDSGMIVPEGDSATLATALETLIDSPELRKQYAARGLERARTQFSWAKVAQNQLEFFQELIESNRARQSQMS